MCMPTNHEKNTTAIAKHIPPKQQQANTLHPNEDAKALNCCDLQSEIESHKVAETIHSGVQAVSENLEIPYKKNALGYS